MDFQNETEIKPSKKVSYFEKNRKETEKMTQETVPEFVVKNILIYILCKKNLNGNKELTFGEKLKALERLLGWI